MTTPKMDASNYKLVLRNIQAQITEGTEWERKVWFEAFNEMLDSLAGEDFFGTEGQKNPLGDQRD